MINYPFLCDIQYPFDVFLYKFYTFVMRRQYSEPMCLAIPSDGLAHSAAQVVVWGEVEIALSVGYVAKPVALTDYFELVAVERARTQADYAPKLSDNAHETGYP